MMGAKGQGIMTLMTPTTASTSWYHRIKYCVAGFRCRHLRMPSPNDKIYCKYLQANREKHIGSRPGVSSSLSPRRPGTGTSCPLLPEWVQVLPWCSKLE